MNIEKTLNPSSMQLTHGAASVGRVLLGLYFLLPGIMKFVAWEMHVNLMLRHEMIWITPLLTAAGVVQIALGIALIVNRYTIVSCFVLAGLVLLINITLHDFWNFTGIEAAHEKQNLVKNLAIFAGLLVLAGYSNLMNLQTNEKD